MAKECQTSETQKEGNRDPPPLQIIGEINLQPSRSYAGEGKIEHGVEQNRSVPGGRQAVHVDIITQQNGD